MPTEALSHTGVTPGSGGRSGSGRAAARRVAALIAALAGGDSDSDSDYGRSTPAAKRHRRSR